MIDFIRLAGMQVPNHRRTSTSHHLMRFVGTEGRAKSSSSTFNNILRSMNTFKKNSSFERCFAKNRASKCTYTVGRTAPVMGVVMFQTSTCSPGFLGWLGTTSDCWAARPGRHQTGLQCWYAGCGWAEHAIATSIDRTVTTTPVWSCMPTPMPPTSLSPPFNAKRISLLRKANTCVSGKPDPSSLALAVDTLVSALSSYPKSGLAEPRALGNRPSVQGCGGGGV